MFDETTQAHRKMRSDVPIKAFSFCELRKRPPADSVPEPPQKGAIIIQITMPQNTPHWNLTETAAWIVFRNLSVVKRFSDPAPENWQAYMMYESMWLCPKVAEPSELGGALRSGRLSALGRSGDTGSKMMTIPAIEWETLIVRPPSAYRLLPDNTPVTRQTCSQQRLSTIRSGNAGSEPRRTDMQSSTSSATMRSVAARSATGQACYL